MFRVPNDQHCSHWLRNYRMLYSICIQWKRRPESDIVDETSSKLAIIKVILNRYQTLSYYFCS